jgi:RNA-binding protein YhbY
MADNKDKIKQELFETSVIVQDAFRSISDNISEMFKDALGVTETFSKSLDKDITKSLSSLAKTTTLLEGNYNKISKGEINRRDILEQIEQRELKIRSIETSIEIAKRNQVSIADNLVKELNEAIQAEEIIKAKLLEQADTADKINKTIGITGALLKGIGKIPIIGNLIDTKAALEAAAATADKGGTKFAAMGAALKSVGKDLLGAFTDPLITIGLFVKAFKLLVELGFKADTQITNLSKSMAISKDQATGVRDRFVEIQNSAESLFETTENLVNAQLELADAFGATQGFTERQVRDQVYLTKQLKLTAEEASGIQQLSMANGMTAEQITKSVIKQTASLVKQTGIQLDNKKVLGEVAKVSGQLRLQYQNNPELIAKAVVQAQKLGITLEQSKKSASSLLNFEQSIASELEAELLTGKNLNFEEARRLALNGKSAEAAAEMLKHIDSSSEFINMNIIQQEAIAASMGMQVDELANALVQQENLNNLGDKSRKQIEEKVNALKAQGKIEEANQLLASVGNEEQAKAALDRISAQDTFNLAVEKLKAMVGSLVEGPMAGFLDKITSLLKDTEKLKAIFAGLKVVLASIAGIMAAMAISFAIMNPVAAAVGAAVAVGAGLYTYSQIKDGEIDSKGGLVVSGEKGTYKLDPNDHVIAGTELGRNRGRSDSSNNNMVDEFRLMRSEISKLGNRPINVSIQVDGKEIAKAVGQSTSEYGTSSSTNAYRIQ